MKIAEFLRAFLSRMLNILTFTILKSCFINFNASFYNPPNIKLHLNNIIFILPLSLSFHHFLLNGQPLSATTTINHQHSTANPNWPTHCLHNQHLSKNQPHSQKKKTKNKKTNNNKNYTKLEREKLTERKRGRLRIERRTKPTNPRPTVVTASKTHQTQDPRLGMAIPIG